METIGREIKRRLVGITSQALASAPERVERDGLVSFEVLPTRLIGVASAIMPLGHSLRVPLEAMCAWALDHGPAVNAAIADCDAMRAREAA